MKAMSVLNFVNYLEPSTFLKSRPHAQPCPLCRDTLGRTRVVIRSQAVGSSMKDISQREVDPRGFIVPRLGDIVLYPGRWRDEDKVGLVDGMRYVEPRSSYNVDILEMKEIGEGLYAVSGRTRGKSKRWFDVSEVKVAVGATYEPRLDAYRVENVRTGYKEVVEDAEARERSMRDYELLKMHMLKEVSLAACGGAVLTTLFAGPQIGSAFGLGAVAGFAYLAILQQSVDKIGKAPPALFLTRYAMPVLPFILLSIKTARIHHVAHEPAQIISAIPKAEVAAVIIGFLTYKVPVLRRTGSEFIKSLATMKPSGTMGIVANTAVSFARALTSSKARQQEERPPLMKTIFVFAGPSGVGKSTLIHRLMESRPGDIKYSVSHTTRGPRNDEVDGIDYHFVSDSEFEAKITAGDFIEYAQVHEYYYGTTYQAVEEVASQGQLCVLDVDLQGVENLRRRAASLSWDLRLIWVTPPTLDALRERLVQRGTETEESLKLRMSNAQKEMEHAATHNIFDLILINDDLETAFKELSDFVSKIAHFSKISEYH